MSEDAFFEFLKNLPKSFTSEAEFSLKISEFSSILGYDNSELFFNVDYQGLQADAVLASSRTARPWVSIEIKLMSQRLVGLTQIVINQINRFRSEINPEYVVFITPEVFAYSDEARPYFYTIDKLTEEDALEIYEALKKPASLPNESIYELVTDLEKIESENFNINLRFYSKHLKLVFEAKTNDEKKKSLEGMAKLLFESIPFLSCKYRDLYTNSSEIDLVIEYENWDKKTIFDELGRYFLVECKHLKDSVGASQVRDFISKLRKTKIKLGVLFALKGVSGKNKGKDALNEIKSAFDLDGLYIIVISEENLKQIENGISFYDILDRKYDEIRFDLKI